MSKYYNIQGLRVRVSDHEPNTSLNGSSDIYFYTKDACNNVLDIEAQVEAYCEKNDMDIQLFAQVIADYKVEEVSLTSVEKVIVSSEFIEGYVAITGKGSSKRRERYCAAYGVSEYQISQGKYIINS